MAVAVERDFKRGPKRGNCFVCGIPLPKTAGGRRQHDAANVAKTPPRQGVQETTRWRQTWVSGNGSNIGFTRRGILCSSYPVKTSGMQVDSGCTDHIVTNIDAFLDFVPIQCGQKSQRRGFQSGAQRLCEDQHTLKQRGIPMRTQKCFVCAGLFFKPLNNLKMHSSGNVASLSRKKKAAWNSRREPG